MQKFRIATLVAAGLLVSASFAADGNARCAGMGIAYDRIGLLDDPHEIVNWKDFVQMSGFNTKDVWHEADEEEETEAGYAPNPNGGHWNFLATKSIGDNFVIGLSSNINQYGELKDLHISDDVFGLNTHSGTDLPFEEQTYLPMPQLHFGFNINDNVAMGFKVFGDNRHYKSFEKADTVKFSKKELKANVTNVGLKMGASIGIGEISLSPTFGLSLPNTHWKFTSEADGEADAETKASTIVEAKTMGDLKLEGGLGFDAPLSEELSLSLGVSFESFKYGKFKRFYADGKSETNEKDAEFKIHKDLSFAGWLGLSGTIGEGLDWGLEWDPGLSLSKVLITKNHKNVDGKDSSSTEFTDKPEQEFTNTVGLTFEKAVECTKLVDVITPRCGFIYKQGQNWNKKDFILKNKAEVKDSWNNNEGFTLATGFGITKGRATLDIATDLAKWSAGAFIGPDVVAATLTVDIAKKD